LPIPLWLMVLAQWWIMKDPASRAIMVLVTKPLAKSAKGSSSKDLRQLCNARGEGGEGQEGGQGGT
jgi:hypothetical protein